MSLTRQIAVLLGLSFGLALASQVVRNNPLPWVEAWSSRVEREAEAAGLKLLPIEEVAASAASFSHVLLDARPPDEYFAGRIPGALNLPVHEYDAYAPQILPILLPDQPVILYCSGEDCDDSIELGRQLQAQGYTNLYMFAGGFAAWEASGREVEQ